MTDRRAIACLVGFIATIPAANLAISNIGVECYPCLVPVGFGMMAPSGVLMIGAALVLRDAVHEMLGARMAIAAVLIGAALSAMTSSPGLAAASAVAFLVAELSDMAIYAPLRSRGRHIAVMASGVVGAAVDSLLFVLIAFGSVDLALGTMLAKVYASAAASAWLWWRK